MRNIFNFLTRLMNGEIIGTDKFLHFFVTYFIASVFENIGAGFIVAFSLAVIKELYDWIVRKTKFDTMDILASALGALLNLIINLIHNYAG